MAFLIDRVLVSEVAEIVTLSMFCDTRIDNLIQVVISLETRLCQLEIKKDEEISSLRRAIEEANSKLAENDVTLDILRYIASAPDSDSVAQLKARIVRDINVVKLVPTHGEFGFADFFGCLSKKKLSRFVGREAIAEMIVPPNIEEIGKLCFYRCSSLSRVTFASGSSMKRIGSEAFRECNRLLDIEIPFGVEEIGDQCFYRCDSLDMVTFASGSNLRSIGDEAFSDCRKLRKIEIPANVEKLGKKCFLGCVYLSRVQFLGICLTRLEDYAFSDCNRLSEIEITVGIAEIGERCFSKSGLSHINFASGGCLRYIGSYAFSDCIFLEKIEIPVTVEEIGEKCFTGSMSFPMRLKKLAFPNGSRLKVIGREAFYGCERLEEIEIPASIERIGDGCFSGCPIANMRIHSSRLRIETLDQCMVCVDGVCLNSIDLDIREIRIPAGIEEIGVRCFYGLSGLRSVTFEYGSRLIRMGDEAFYGCINLKEIEVPSSVEEIGEKCFSSLHPCAYDHNLSRVVFCPGSHLKYIGSKAFYSCHYLDEIEIPASVEEIGDECFCMTHLLRVTFASGSVLKRIGKCVFGYRFSEIEIPASIEEIGDSCFMYCSSLSRVTFVSGSVPKCIGKDAFCGCKELREIEIPASVEEIDENCFLCCSSLSRVTFVSGSVLKRIGKYAFRGCSKLREIEIPAGVEKIGDSCFSSCSSLSSVTFENGCRLRKIGNYAFSDCGFHEIQLPASIEELGVSIFSRCDISNMYISEQSEIFKVIDPFIALRDVMQLKCIFRNVNDVEIPSYIKEIGEGCFAGSSLSRVTFVSGCDLKIIGKDAFSGCKNLTEIEIPASVEEIRSNCFYSCSLSRVTFAEGSCLKRIGDKAFCMCGCLREIKIPASVEEIGAGCFSGCNISNETFSSSNLFTVLGPFLVRVSGMCLISDLGKLEGGPYQRIKIPAIVEEICDGCFSDCSLSSVAFENGSRLKRIGKEAFHSSSSPLSSLGKIPASVEEIGEKCFSEYSMPSVAFENGSRLKRIGKEAFPSRWSIDISIPVSVEVGENVGATIHRYD